MKRAVIHSDLNCFYASVETVLDPSLRGKAVAVCGKADDRHGIVLAKSEKAKRAGIKTGMPNGQALRLCPDLIIKEPDFEEYVKFSKYVRQIYLRYTDMVEPFGIDECWLDVGENTKNLDEAYRIAEDIRQTVKRELGLTVSAGVSFCKTFAKLGSDMKKPDAVTVITEDDFRLKVWPLPVSELLYVGKSTVQKLKTCGINTIGDLAGAELDFLVNYIGINGKMIWEFANGLDRARVMKSTYEAEVKSVGHGITCTSDLEKREEVWLVMLELTQVIAQKLYKDGLYAGGVQIAIKSNDLKTRQYQCRLDCPTMSPMGIAKTAYALFCDCHKLTKPIRAVTVRAINIEDKPPVCRVGLFDNVEKELKAEKLDRVIFDIRMRYGKKSIRNASLMGVLKIPCEHEKADVLPGMMYI